MDSSPGLVPVAIGFKQLLDKRKSDLEGPRLGHPGVVSIALLTHSNGADNVGVYIPLFIVSRPYLLLILAVYALLVAALCYVGRWLGRHSLILRAVDRGGHWVVPLVFIALGIYVLGT